MKRHILGRVLATVVVVSAVALMAGPDAWAGTSNFAGYTTAVVGAASADVTVPAANSLSCSSSQAGEMEFWVALLKGQYAAEAGVYVQCVKGSPLTYVAGTAGTASFRFPVNGGDAVTLSVSETATATAVTADDTTSTVNEISNFLGATTTPTVVDFGAYSISKKLPIFGPVTYSSAQVDGVPLAAPPATLHKLVRSHQGVHAGTLSSGSFTLTEV
jgi:hypothetical protein